MPTLETGVHVQRTWTGTLVGVYLPNQTYHYRVGGYDFSNIFSANMFAHLQTTKGVEKAKMVIKAFETKMTANEAGKEAFITIISTIDWKPLLTGNAPAALTGTLKNAVSLACDKALGGWVRSQFVQSYGNKNPFDPIVDGPLWAPDSVREQFLLYAIDYWKTHQDEGPAYRSSSGLVRPKT